MNRIDRLTAILIHLQSRRMVKAADIAARFEISLRTVYRDIRALEEAGVPIGAEPGKGYYIVAGYHLPPVMFTKDEAGALLIGAKLVAKFSDKSIDRQFNDALYKIKAVLNLCEKDHLDALSDHIEVMPAIHNERENSDNSILLEIQSVLSRRVRLKIDYFSFYKEELTSRVIEPIGLCFYGSHWHLIAFCCLRNDYRDFRVDRIRTLAKTPATFSMEKHDSLQTLVQRLMVTERLNPVTVRFRNSVAKYIHEQRCYFGFVSERIGSTHTEMDFMVSSLDYVARWLLSFVDDVEVMAPDRLKECIYAFSQRLFEHHGPQEKI